MRFFVAPVALLVSATALPQSLPIGALAHDGPATPEQISLLLPVTGALPQTSTATVRYKQSATSTWVAAHPLYRVRPDFSETPAVWTVADVFAWPIIGLSPGTAYDVEVTVSSGTTVELRTASFATRSLPPAAGAPNKTVAAGSSGAQLQAALDGLNPGDVLQIENGTYNVSELTINRSGTANAPIYVRGQTRDGVVITDATDSVFSWANANYVVLENLTLRGSNVDGGLAVYHWGIHASDQVNPQYGTIRNVTVTGVQQGIVFDTEVSGFLIYDNTLVGTNLWTNAYLDSNLTWDDDGIRPPGFGNVVFNNSLRGFGDSLSAARHSGGTGLTEVRGLHFYRNEIRNSGDDLFEGDYGQRNITLYDNRSHNSMTFVSLDPFYGGPLVAARNILINIGRTPFKWNSTNSGQFVYNNTMVIGETLHGFSGWYQPNNGAQRAYGYRNNILVYRGGGDFTPWLESTVHDPIDFSHNSWYPNIGLQWGSVYNSLAAAQAGLPNTTPIFSGQTKRMFQDNATTADPFEPAVPTGTNFLSEVTGTFVPTLETGSSPKNSGVTIANITDDFTGAAPDRGAVISGRAPIAWGDRAVDPSKVPAPPTTLTVN
jgi:hypothetical protein